MTLSNETLHAYVDGELDATARAAVEAAIAANPALAREVERHRALRARLKSVGADVLEDPVPERLLTAARTAPAVGARGGVADLAAARAARSARGQRRWALPEWSAIAASLVLGLVLGQRVLGPADSGPLTSQDGQLVARGALAQALSHQLASEASPAAPVHLALSFRDQSGRYCRTFVLREDRLAGLACRAARQWEVEALARGGEPQDGEYRMAGAALPPSVLQAVQERIEGDPLDAAAEAAARERSWR